MPLMGDLLGQRSKLRYQCSQVWSELILYGGVVVDDDSAANENAAADAADGDGGDAAAADDDDCDDDVDDDVDASSQCYYIRSEKIRQRPCTFIYINVMMMAMLCIYK